MNSSYVSWKLIIKWVKKNRQADLLCHEEHTKGLSTIAGRVNIWEHCNKNKLSSLLWGNKQTNNLPGRGFDCVACAARLEYFKM